jgi:hypothetical protein
MVTNALGIFTGSTTAFVNGSGVLATPPGSATTGTNVLFGNGSGGFSTTGLSVQLSAALTDETGSGAVVFGTSPTFITQISITNSGGSATLTTDATTNTLALRSGTAPQAFRAYNTFTDASNYERGVLSWSGNQLEIGTEIAGSGSARAVLIKAAGAGGLIVLRPGGAAAGWQFTAARNIVAETDNSFTIGTAGANRPLGVIIGPSGGIGTTGTNTVVTAATGATNTLSYDIILYVTTATSAALTDNAGTTEFSGVAISAFTPIRLQPGGKFTGTSITYATGTTSHAW